MKAYVLKQTNEKLVKDEINLRNEQDEVVVPVLYAGINRRDLWIQKGMYPNINLPAVLGSDGLVLYEGEKYLVNPNVNWGNNPLYPSKSYSILGLERSGTFAEKISIPKDRLFKKPNHLSDEQAAVIPLAGLTAYRALISNCKLTSKDRVFINGIGGGVATFAALFAIAIGAEVYVSSSSDIKIKRAVQLGAKGGVNYKEENWGKAFKKQEGGFDVIIDSAGGDGFKELINLANRGARIGIYGGTRGMITDISPQHLFFKQIHIFGSTMGNDEEFAKMIELVDQYKIEPIVDEVFHLDEINKAFKASLDKSKFGKIAIKIQ